MKLVPSCRSYENSKRTSAYSTRMLSVELRCWRGPYVVGECHLSPELLASVNEEVMRQDFSEKYGDPERVNPQQQE